MVKQWAAEAWKLPSLIDVEEIAVTQFGGTRCVRVLEITLRPFITKFAEADVSFADDLFQRIFSHVRELSELDSAADDYYLRCVEALHHLKGGLGNSGLVEAANPAYCGELIAEAIHAKQIGKVPQHISPAHDIHAVMNLYTENELITLFPPNLACLQRRMNLFVGWYNEKVKPLMERYRDEVNTSESED